MGGQKWGAVCEGPLGDQGWRGGGTELGRGLRSPQALRQLPVTVARAMAGGLSGMPGTDILLLDSWMQQKGVDGFSLSVSSFHIQQIRVAGCCGDHTEEGSRTPAPQTEPASVDLGRPGGQLLRWET